MHLLKKIVRRDSQRTKKEAVLNNDSYTKNCFLARELVAARCNTIAKLQKLNSVPIITTWGIFHQKWQKLSLTFFGTKIVRQKVIFDSSRLPSFHHVISFPLYGDA